MTYESQEEADFFEGDRGESARAEAEYDQMVHEKEGQLGEDCCEKCQAECFRASQIAPNCYHDCHCHQPSEEKKCVCGLEICLGGAEVEIGGVCHRIGNPCYIIEPKISEEKKDWEERFDGYYNSLGLDHVVSFGEISNRERIKDFIREKLKEEQEALLKEILAEVDEKKTTEDGDHIERQQYHFYNLALSEVKELIRNKII